LHAIMAELLVNNSIFFDGARYQKYTLNQTEKLERKIRQFLLFTPCNPQDRMQEHND